MKRAMFLKRKKAEKSLKGNVPEAFIPLCDTLVRPEVLPRDEVVEMSPSCPEPGLLDLNIFFSDRLFTRLPA